MAFTHLHVHTEFSLLDGASRIEDLVHATKEAGMNAVAITDHGNMYGVIDFYKAAKKEGIKPIIGCEVYVAPAARQLKEEVDGTRYYHLILLAENMQGYRNLAKLVSLANIEGMYYKPRIDKELMKKYHAGIIALSACIAGEIPRAILRDNMEKADALTQEYMKIFGRENFFIEIQNHGLPEEKKANRGLIELARKYDLGLVATNDAHYVHREDSDFHDILLCIQMNKMYDDPDRMRFSSDDYYLKSPEEMAGLFPEFPEALANTEKIAERCNVDFTFGELQLPYYPIPKDFKDAAVYLRHLCESAIPSHYGEVSEKVKNRLDYELGIIHSMGFDDYFLIVWDFIRAAKEKEIPVGPGRGSAAGSIVSYLLGITDLDPLTYDLLFERFLNPERVTMPDIDVDICYVRRKEVIDYVKNLYGDDHVAQIVTFGTFAARGAIRDVGRILAMSFGDVSEIVTLIPEEPKMTIRKAMKESADFRATYDANPQVKKLIDYAMQIEGLPRHSSTHAAGVVIAKKPLTEYLPVAMTDGTLVTEYDKDHVEELGLLKMDFLGLRTLTVISDTLSNIRQSRGTAVKIEKIPLKDEATARMLTEGKTGAIFQMESQGMTNLVKELAPEDFSDLIPLVALYRPGPLGSGMVEDFIAGRHGKKEVTYLHPLLEPILKETFGVVLYQEQVMQIVQVLAGFTLGQADILRRAMGKKKQEILMAQKENFLTGCAEHGIKSGLANTIFDLLTHFADYGFNKSHSAAYALVAWQTAYLKAHYPAEFMAAMLTSIVDTQKVPQYIEQCRRMKISILPPDINASFAFFSVDGDAIRFGLAAVRNVGDAAIENIIDVRNRNGKFCSLVDFCSRVDMRTANKRVLESLIKCGAFDSLGAKRSQLLAVLPQAVSEAMRNQQDALSGQIGLFPEEELSAALQLPDIEEASREECLAWEKENTGFYITGHPLDAYHEKLDNLPSISTLQGGNIKDKQLVRVGGILIETKRITTRKGETMCFATLEDYMSQAEVTIFPRLFYQNIDLLMPDTPVVIEGHVDLAGDGLKILADRIWSVDAYTPTYYIELPKSGLSAEARKDLQKIIAEHRGSSETYFYNGNRWQKGGEAFWLSDTKETMEALEAFLGKGAVRKR